jgi:hypothetical protein
MCIQYFKQRSFDQQQCSPKKILISVALRREQTIPTERPSFVGEVLWLKGVAWSVQRIPTAVFSDFWTGNNAAFELRKDRWNLIHAQQDA